MVPEMVLTPESLAAHFTRERSLVGVRALVDQEVVGLGELSLAVLADELLLRSGDRDGVCNQVDGVLSA